MKAQHFEEDRKGSIEPGKIADFVILSDDPTAVDPETLAEIQVLVTLKENEVVYAADQKRQAARSRTSPIANDPEFGHHLVDALFSATRSQ